jgi:hypothetical protein
MKYLVLLLLPVFFISCGKKDSKDLEEKTQRELVVENQNMEVRAAVLEADLARKQLFFSALEGTYEGTFTAGEKVFKTRMTFIPSLPPYTSNRVRTLEEVTADLNNLFFSVQTTHWNAQGTAVAAGCIFGQVKPDYDNGQVSAASENCSNVYKVSFYDSSSIPSTDTPVKTSEIFEKSQVIAKKILNKEVSSVEEVYVIIQPTLLAKTFIAVLKRVQP